VSSSPSEGLRRVLTRRLALALAASAALHALLVGGLGSPGGEAEARAGAALSAILVSEAAAEERPAAAPAARPALRTGPLLKRYYRRSELDVAPNIMTRVVPEYPHMAHVSGKVTIRVFIDERGTVERVAVLRAEPPGHFEASAQKAFLAARFTPGMKRGVAVKSQLTLQVDYTQPR
jgi:protein TonB